MKVIVEHDENACSYLGQYTRQIETLSKNYKVLDLEEKHLSWLSQITSSIEPNFIIELCSKEEPINKTIVDTHDMILAFIGAKSSNAPINIYYNMKTHLVEKSLTRSTAYNCELISCYSKDHKINAADYIKCIQFLAHKASELHKPIIIYANLYVPDETYRYRSLTYKIINTCLTSVNGVLITKSFKENICKYYTPSSMPFEFYLDNTLYLEESLNDILTNIFPLLHVSKENVKFKNMYKSLRQTVPLYNDVFYGAISPDQEIYVFLNYPLTRDPQYYEALGLQYINLLGNYGMLYAKKSIFDSHSTVLKPEVVSPYYIPISSHAPCIKNNIVQNASYHLVKEDLQYKGLGVYIGIITTDNVDYTNQALRTSDGRTRIAYIWEQTESQNGKYFFKEHIDDALKSENPIELIRLPTGDSISTMMLGIAGGRTNVPSYSGVATEAEFIVAKVNTAPEMLQTIYGGMPNNAAALMSDILIGCIKLIDLAAAQGKPLVLCLPFNSNIDPHDGSLIPYQVLSTLAQRNQLTIVVPAGDEADKMHHYGIEGKQAPLNTVSLRIQRANQNIVGIICQRFANILTATLNSSQIIPPAVINLKLMGIRRLDGTTIYSSGEKVNFSNGSSIILFRIDNPPIGTWILESTTETEALSQIDVWISQQELNPYITLNPASPFISIGSTSAANNVMTVGGYDQEQIVVLKSSGRGFSWDNRIKPLFVTASNNITAPCGQGEWVSVTGTLAAASIMAGVSATLYSKFLYERVYPLPNTLVMNSMILSIVKQLEVIEYPNQSYGYGLFDLQSLDTLLAKPLIL